MVVGITLFSRTKSQIVIGNNNRIYIWGKPGQGYDTNRIWCPEGQSQVQGNDLGLNLLECFGYSSKLKAQYKL